MKKKKIVLLLAGFSLLLCSCSTFPNGNNASEDTPLQESSQEESIPTIIVDSADRLSEEMAISENTPSGEDFHGYSLSEQELSDPRVICKETQSENQVTMVFAGDIAFDDNYSNMNALRGRKNGIIDSLSSDLMEQLTGADIFMVNNEFPYSDRGTPTAGKTFTFRAKPERAALLNDMGVDIVSLANNHAYDFGPDALLDTMSILQNANVPYVGAGSNLDEATKPVYFIAGGMKIAIVSATQIERLDPPDTREATADSPGVLRTLDPTKFLSVIEEAEQNSDFVVVYVHWGSENEYEVDASQKDLANQYVEKGADLIIGDHSHCLQGIEYIGEVPVIYSVGNFWFNSKDLDTGIIKVTLQDSKISSYQFLPCRQHDCRTDLLVPGTTGDYERVLSVMAGLSGDVSIHSDGIVTNGAGDGVKSQKPRPLEKPTYAVSDNVPIVPAAPTDGTAPETEEDREKAIREKYPNLEDMPIAVVDD